MKKATKDEVVPGSFWYFNHFGMNNEDFVAELKIRTVDTPRYWISIIKDGIEEPVPEPIFLFDAQGSQMFLYPTINDAQQGMILKFENDIIACSKKLSFWISELNGSDEKVAQKGFIMSRLKYWSSMLNKYFPEQK